MTVAAVCLSLNVGSDLLMARGTSAPRVSTQSWFRFHTGKYRLFMNAPMDAYGVQTFAALL